MMQLAAFTLQRVDQHKSVSDTMHDRLRISFSSALCSIVCAFDHHYEYGFDCGHVAGASRRGNCTG